MSEDESRQKTIKFLLLRMARGFSSSQQAVFEDALRTLLVADEKDYWRISISTNKKEESILVSKSAFSLYQTRQTNESEIDPGVKNQLSALKVLDDLFSNFGLEHHQYKREQKIEFRDLFVKYFGLTSLVINVVSGAAAAIFSMPFLITFSTVGQILIFKSLFLIRFQRFFAFIFYVISFFYATIKISDFDTVNFTICSMALLILYFFESDNRKFTALKMLVLAISIASLVLFVTFVGKSDFKLLPLVLVCLASIGLNVLVISTTRTVWRLVGFVAFVFASGGLLLIATANSVWSVYFLVLVLFHAASQTILGNEKSVTRVLVGIPLLGALI